MLNIIYGKARTGKSTYIYNEIKKRYIHNNDENRKTYVLVPEQFNLSIEETLSKHLGFGGLFNIEILTFKRMAYLVFDELGIDIDHINEIGQKVIIYNILNKNKYNIFNSSNKGNIEKLMDVFSEFSRYNVSPEEIKNIKYENSHLKDKIDDLTNIYMKYNDVVESTGKTVENDLTILMDHIENSSLLKDNDIYIDEFYGFTNQEYDLICVLAKNNNVTITFCIDDNEVSQNPIDIYNSNKSEYTRFKQKCSENGIKIDNEIICGLPYNNEKNPDIVHLQENIFAYPYKEYIDESKNVHIYSCINTYTEIENLAKNIRLNILAGNKYNQIAVITRDVEKYADLIWGIFKKYDIPYFLDVKKDINSNQISQLIFSILDIVTTNFSYESVFAYLKTGFLDIDIDDIYKLENYAIKWGIKGHKFYTEFKYGSKDNESNEELNKLNILREQVITPLLEFKKGMETKKNIKDIVNLLYRFLMDNQIQTHIQDKINVFKQTGNSSLEKEYSDIWNYYIDAFEQLTISLEGQEIDIYEFRNILEISLENTQKGTLPIFKDAVLIGDIERTRSNKINILYFIGVQNDKFPITFNQEGILNDNDRTFLKNNNIELAKTTNQRILDDQFNIYKIITMTDKQVNFSYIFNDLDGTSFRPSFLINKIKKMLDINEISVDNEYVSSIDVYNKNSDFDNLFSGDVELLKWYIEYVPKDAQIYKQICEYRVNMNPKIAEENLIKIYGDKYKSSISRIEEYVKCPYSFYLKYGLNIKERDVYTVKMLDIGSFNHEVLENFFAKLINEKVDFKTLNKQKCDQLSAECIDSMFANISSQVIKNAKQYNILKLKFKKTLQTAIWVLVIQIKNSSFRPIGTEVEFGEGKQYHEIQIELDSGKTVALKGIIDRIDLADTKDGQYIRIIDYKSSSKSVDVSDIYNGLRLQLITYMDAITQKQDNIIPGGILYFKVDDPYINADSKITNEQLEKEILNELRLNGIILNDKTLISHMDNNITSKSDLVNIKIGADGLSNNKNALDLNEFKKLQGLSKQILKRICNQIYTGKIDVKPYFESKRTGCEYCSYNSICKFNKKNPDCKYNIMKKYNKEDLLK